MESVRYLTLRKNGVTNAAVPGDYPERRIVHPANDRLR